MAGSALGETTPAPSQTEKHRSNNLASFVQRNYLGHYNTHSLCLPSPTSVSSPQVTSSPPSLKLPCTALNSLHTRQPPLLPLRTCTKNPPETANEANSMPLTQSRWKSIADLPSRSAVQKTGNPKSERPPANHATLRGIPIATDKLFNNPALSDVCYLEKRRDRKRNTPPQGQAVCRSYVKERSARGKRSVRLLMTLMPMTSPRMVSRLPSPRLFPSGVRRRGSRTDQWFF